MGDSPKTLADVKALLEEAVQVVDALAETPGTVEQQKAEEGPDNSENQTAAPPTA